MCSYKNSKPGLKACMRHSTRAWLMSYLGSSPKGQPRFNSSKAASLPTAQVGEPRDHSMTGCLGRSYSTKTAPTAQHPQHSTHSTAPTAQHSQHSTQTTAPTAQPPDYNTHSTARQHSTTATGHTSQPPQHSTHSYSTAHTAQHREYNTQVDGP